MRRGSHIIMEKGASTIIVGNSKGFTLVELLLALVIGSIILGAGYMATTAGHQASTGIEQKISSQQDIRAALGLMATEISMASYNPTDTNGLWVSSTCGAGAPVANRGIQQATADGSTLTVEMDINENGTVGDPNDVITYVYDVNNE